MRVAKPIRELALCLLLGGVGTARMAMADEQRAEISFAQAERIALERVPDGRIDDIERELQAGRLVYEVEMHARQGGDYELIIDALDGHIIAAQIDD